MSTINDSNIRHVRAKTLTLHWHEGAAAIYTVGTQPMKPGERSMRLVTGGGDNNIRVWKVNYNKEGTEVEGVEYLSSITKHTQAVNCVRFNRTGDLLATASDDGTIMIWEINDTIVREFGQDTDDDIKESWVLKIACFASNMSEIYDICWSPDSKYICCGLMDNIIRIFNVATGSMVKQIAEHSHYVQGVAWDPRGDYICSQSADRSVHVYKVSNSENGELIVGPTAFYKSIKSDVPSLKLSQFTFDNLSKNSKISNTSEKILSSTPTDTASNTRASTPTSTQTPTQTSNPVSSATSASNSVMHTPIINSVNISNINSNMNSINMVKQSSNSSKAMEPPQAPRHKRTYSNSSTGSSHSIVRCLSPLPLPAVMPSSPNHLHLGLSTIMSPNLSNPILTIPNGNNNNNVNIPTSVTHSNSTSISNSNPVTTNLSLSDAYTPSSSSNTPTISYKQHYLYHNETLQSFFRRLTFSPDGSMLITTCGIYKSNTENGKEEIQNTVYVYTRAGLNKGPVVHLPGLRKPAIVVRFSPVKYALTKDNEISGNSVNVFNLKYRMLFAVATQDSILIYDTQQLKCVVIVTNIHYAVITDVAWSTDGRTVFVSSNDGFISSVVIGDDIVGDIIGGFDLKELEELSKEESVPVTTAPVISPIPVSQHPIPTNLPTKISTTNTSVLTPSLGVPIKTEHATRSETISPSCGVKRDVLEMLSKKEGGEGNEDESDSKRSCV